MNIWKNHKTLLLPSINGGNIGRNPARQSDNKLYYYSHGVTHSEAHHLIVLADNNQFIASTDKSLGLPGIPESFLKEFCERGGIDEVMVEYETHLVGWNEEHTEDGSFQNPAYQYMIKIWNGSEVSIKPPIA